MKVKLAEIEASIPRPSYPYYAVGIRLIICAEATGLMDDVDELRDFGVEYSRVLGVRYHQSGGSLRDRRF